VTVSAATASPGEHLLHAIAARLLAAPPAIPPDTRLHPAAPGPGPVTTAADGLGDVIAALQAVGALSPLSPVPGQLAALCARLHVSGHGITAPPVRDLPGPWPSMLAHSHHRNTRRRRPRRLRRCGRRASRTRRDQARDPRLARLPGRHCPAHARQRPDVPRELRAG
jgi:hypothetical protein